VAFGTERAFGSCRLDRWDMQACGLTTTAALSQQISKTNSVAKGSILPPSASDS